MNHTIALEYWLNNGIPIAARKLTEKHELCIKILSVIDAAERRRRNYLEDAEDGIGNLFPELRKKYKHKAEISGIASERLWRRYFKVCQGLTE